MYIFIAEDQYYYTQEGLAEIKKTYKVKTIEIINIDQTSMKDIIHKYINLLKGNNKDDLNNYAALIPVDLADKYPDFSKTSFLEKIYLKNKYGLLTTFQHTNNVSKEDILKRKLDVSIKKPKVTLSDYGGAEALMREVEVIRVKEQYGLTVKGFLIAGIPGSGKSFFAECLAGELDRFLIELNLSKFMEYPRPLDMLNNFFDFFQNNDGEYIIRIDEIEKMLTTEKSEEILGLLLTRINDFGKSDTKAKAFVVATANDLSVLLKKHPELPRAGRFDYLLYLGAPTPKDAFDIFDIYIKKNINFFKQSIIPQLKQEFEENKKVNYPENSLRYKITAEFKKNANIEPEEVFEKIKFGIDVQMLIHKAQVRYRKGTDRFVYTPAEIEYIVDTIFAKKILGGEESENIEENIISIFKPLQVTLESAILTLESNARDFRQI